MLFFYLLTKALVLLIAFAILSIIGLIFIVRGVIILIISRVKRNAVQDSLNKELVAYENKKIKPSIKSPAVKYIAIGILLCIPILSMVPDAIIQESVKNENAKTVIYHLQNDDYDKAALLLEQGADPNIELYSTTPLTYVSYWGEEQDEQMTALLLEHGANPNLSDSHGEIPLLRAILYEENETIVRLLLEYGADPNKTSSSGVTPLEMATNQQNEVLVNLLLEYGAEYLPTY